MKAHKPKRSEKTRKIKSIMQTRRAEKAAEMLDTGWNAIEKGNAKKGLSCFHHATTVYGAPFNAIKIELTAAKRRGFLPTGFKIPENAEELAKLIANKNQKK